MSEVENLILEHLRQISAGQDSLREDMREVKVRLDHLEEQIGGVHTQIASLHLQYASLSDRMIVEVSGSNASSGDWNSSRKSFRSTAIPGCPPAMNGRPSDSRSSLSGRR